MPFGSWWMKQNTHLFAHVEISAARGASSSMESARHSSPPWNWKSIASRSIWPLMARTRSPGRSPATAAAVRGRTAEITTPSAEERFFIRLPLRGVRGVQEAHALHDVLQPGDNRERGGQPHHGAQRPAHVYEAARQSRQHGEHLEERGDLAGARWARIDVATGHVDHECAEHQNEVAADDDGGDPE